MSINANGSIKELRVGSQVIKEARVGSTVVYSAAWPAVPADGVIWGNRTWGSGIQHSNITVSGSTINVSGGNTGIIRGVVFSRSTTKLMITRGSSLGHPNTLKIDGITLTQVSDGSNNYHYDIPESLRNRDAHTIEFNKGNNPVILSYMGFDI